MNLRGRVATAVFAFLIGSSTRAAELGLADGTLTVRGVQNRLQFAYGKRTPALHAGTKNDVMILISSDALPDAALQSDSELGRIVKSRHLSTVEIRLGETMVPLSAVVRQKDSPAMTITSKVYLTPTIASQRLIDARVSYSGADTSFSATFRAKIGDSDQFAPNAAAARALEQSASATLLQPAQSTSSTALPAGGGNPGRALLAFIDAFRRDDLAALKNQMTARSYAAFEQQEKQKEMMAFERATLPIDIRVTSGSVSGNVATLEIAGTPTVAHGPVAGTATIVQEGNAWKFQTWSWSSIAPETPESKAKIAKMVAAMEKELILPSDGGEPAKAWRAYDAAMVRGDMDAIRRLLPDNRVHQFDKVQFDRIRSSREINAHFVGGSVDYDEATLGVDSSSRHGTVTMVRERGVWKVADEVWNQKR